MKLKGRLKLIYDMIPQCDTLCDIGTDHALIPAYALMNNRCRRAIATDVKKGPLKRAEKTLKLYNLHGLMELRLGNGLDAISMDEADVIVMAGMGGMLITRLIEEQLDKAMKARRIIIQPMHAQETVRPFLWRNGFVVDDEALAREGEKLYEVLSVYYDESGTASSSKTPLYAVIGEGLVRKMDPLLEDWLREKIGKQRKKVEGLKAASSPSPELEDEEKLLRVMEELRERLFGKAGQLQSGAGKTDGW